MLRFALSFAGFALLFRLIHALFERLEKPLAKREERSG